MLCKTSVLTLTVSYILTLHYVTLTLTQSEQLVLTSKHNSRFPLSTRLVPFLEMSQCQIKAVQNTLVTVFECLRLKPSFLAVRHFLFCFGSLTHPETCQSPSDCGCIKMILLSPTPCVFLKKMFQFDHWLWFEVQLKVHFSSIFPMILFGGIMGLFRVILFIIYFISYSINSLMEKKHLLQVAKWWSLSVLFIAHCYPHCYVMKYVAQTLQNVSKISINGLVLIPKIIKKKHFTTWPLSYISQKIQYNFLAQVLRLNGSS